MSKIYANVREEMKLYSFHAGHCILQMLFLQAPRNYAARPALPLRRLECIIVIPTTRHLRMPVAMVRLTTVTVKIARCGETITDAKVGLCAAASTRWAVKVRCTWPGF